MKEQLLQDNSDSLNEKYQLIAPCIEHGMSVLQRSLETGVHRNTLARLKKRFEKGGMVALERAARAVTLLFVWQTFLRAIWQKIANYLAISAPVGFSALKPCQIIRKISPLSGKGACVTAAPSPKNRTCQSSRHPAQALKCCKHMVAIPMDSGVLIFVLTSTPSSQNHLGLLCQQL